MGYTVLKRGQSTTEIAFVFAGIVLLFVAIMQIWFWGNKQIVQRQKSYNAGRVTAGTSSDSYTLQWPVYKPEELKEE
ncbi:MAG: hypothetical protein PHJ00_06625, partial [Candidatus Omnitrophica bacterium]|nr:hypothetical protein [Candidatus Omnitrophota bacterium]